VPERPSKHVVYGLHAVREILRRRPEAVVRAWLVERAAGPLAAIGALLRALHIDTRELRRPELDRLADGGVHQGVLLELKPRSEFTIGDFEDLVQTRGRELRLLVLDQVEDPRNLGACLRTADAAGVDAVVVPRARSARLGAAAEKVATGAAETIPVFSAPNLARSLAWLKQAGVWIVGTDAAAGQSLYSARLAPPVGIVLGSEGRGLRRLTRESCDELVSIPMHGVVGSLNVSVAAGVVLFELLRQSPPAPATVERTASH
jgi:23S rRNA (guanosine2251-2'-O)-methyltransferase